MWPVYDAWPGDPAILLEGTPVEDQLEASWDTLRGREHLTEVPRMTQEALRRFVRDVLGGAIFVSDQIHQPDNTGMVFLPIAFGMLSKWNADALRQIGVIWEYDRKALPRSINGLPVFTSCHLMHVEDWKRAHLVIAREQRRQQEMEV